MEYNKYQKELLANMGLNPEKLTQEQVYIALEPIEAPENYHHDGEVTPIEANTIWTGKLKKAGFTPLQVFNIKRAIG